MKLKQLTLGVMLLLFTSCVDDLFIRGNGIPESEVRHVPAFSSVVSEGNFDIRVTHGVDYKVLVNAESNLLPYIETTVKAGALRIDTEGIYKLQNQLPVEILITTPFIREIIQSGSGNITAGSFAGESFSFIVSGSGNVEAMINAVTIEAVLSGSGNILITGIARDAKITVSGSGTVDSRDLAVRNCQAGVSGSGDVWIDVDQFLKAVISGSGSVYYYGSPEIEMVVSGSGSVIRKN